MLQALIFDVDGTIADTERDGHRIANNQAFREAGLDWEWSVETYGELLAVTGGKERIRFYIDHFRPDFESPADLDGFIAELHASKTRFYTDLVRTGRIPARPGVVRLLREARAAGMRLAIATTTTPANVTALLESAIAPDAVSWFEVIGAGDVVPAKKPAPDIYHYVLDRMDLAASDCLAFEDSANGILASHGAGLKTIIAINDYTREHEFPGACLVLDQYGEPEQPFTRLNGSVRDLGGAGCLDLKLVNKVYTECS
jgi:HAD superfamily hydrolase (TIGR01509 family)